MKKHRKQGKGTNRKNQNREQTTQEDTAAAGRRRFLRLARNLAIAGLVVGGSGYALTQNVMSAIHEHDLTRIGNGKPTIVQIHDPNCSMCRALQRETRSALGQLDGDAFDYVIANIKSQKGRSFANRYGVQHVTLLLFDSEGRLKDILEGQRRSSELKRAFQQLIIR